MNRMARDKKTKELILILCAERLFCLLFRRLQLFYRYKDNVRTLLVVPVKADVVVFLYLNINLIPWSRVFLGQPIII
jgi:hypothetical protein